MKRFLLLAVCTTAALFSLAQVIVYDEPGYQGASHRLGEGGISRLKSTNIGSDRISSMRISKGYTVVLFEHDNFGGRSWVYSSDVRMLPGGPNDNASSLIVKRTGSNWNNNNGWGWTGSKAILYSECFYNGKRFELSAGDYSNLNSKFNDMLSSIRVPRGYEVQLFEDKDFRGRSVIIYGDEACIPAPYNNNASSLRIYRSNGSVPDNWDPWDQNNWITGGNNNNNWGRNEAVIYTSCGFTGNSQSFRQGDYRSLPFSIRGKLASIKVPSGYTVVLYSNSGFTGSEYVVRNDERCLPNIVRARTNSMRVVAGDYQGNGGNGGGFGGSGGSGGNGGFGGSGGSGGSGGNGGFGGSGGSGSDNDAVYMYKDCNYRGSFTKFSSGEYPSLSSVLNKQISSVKVPKGWRVIVYSSPNFRGTSFTLTADRSCLPSSWNDKISSFRILR